MAQNISYNYRKCSARRFSNLHSVAFHVFYFKVFQVIFGLHSLYLNKFLLIFSIGCHTCVCNSQVVYCMSVFRKFRQPKYSEYLKLLDKIISL